MFERPHHQRIAHVLAALDGGALAQHACWFGGGTCIALVLVNTVSRLRQK